MYLNNYRTCAKDWLTAATIAVRVMMLVASYAAWHHIQQANQAHKHMLLLTNLFTLIFLVLYNLPHISMYRSCAVAVVVWNRALVSD